MNLSDYVLKFLQEKKIKNVFLITGGAISFMVDAFSRNKKIKYTCVAHEQECVRAHHSIAAQPTSTPP